jgi:catechol 2,3-dioxygenase-like lactoylglutathione lyase family enzyme
MSEQTSPTIVQTVIDTTDARRAAEFYRQLLGLEYRPGDEQPPAGEPDPRGQDWLVLRNPVGARQLAFQQVDSLPRSTWPAHGVPQQLHLDLSVPDAETLQRSHDRAVELGATVLFDRTDDEAEPLWVFADPDGHPFCIFVA